MDYVHRKWRKVRGIITTVHQAPLATTAEPGWSKSAIWAMREFIPFHRRMIRMSKSEMMLIAMRFNGRRR